MKLKQLIRDLPVTVKGSKEIEISGLCSDSRKVAPGNLFLAKKGGTFDGASFISQAVDAGAAAIVTDLFDPFLGKTQIIAENPEELEAILAARCYGEPGKSLFVVGITGSKGKTTTSYLVKHLLDGIGKPSGLIGTVETVIGENRFFSTLTTHDVISNQKMLREMVTRGCKAVSLEVSSHGLHQNRVDEIPFDLGIFTNLYLDHLDYHLTIEEYAKAKRELFRRAKRSILNADSPWAEFMGSGLTFGIEKGDLRAEKIRFTEGGSEFEVRGTLFKTGLIGRYNIYNLLGAIAVGVELGVDLAEISAVLSSFQSVPGRLEKVGENIFVDFAHTGEALENVLKTLKELGKRVIVVFGCGGNRDPGRRAGMGKAAAEWADFSIVTSDNPRQEDPDAIIRQILAAFPHLKNTKVEPDRRKAIQLAISMAGKGDLVLIAGKGHERGQIFGSQQIPFDDVEVAKNLSH